MKRIFENWNKYKKTSNESIDEDWMEELIGIMYDDVPSDTSPGDTEALKRAYEEIMNRRFNHVYTSDAELEAFSGEQIWAAVKKAAAMTDEEYDALFPGY
jgi:hypothetical protein